jgi:hypothetical protein
VRDVLVPFDSVELDGADRRGAGNWRSQGSSAIYPGITALLWPKGRAIENHRKISGKPFRGRISEPRADNRSREALGILA